MPPAAVSFVARGEGEDHRTDVGHIDELMRSVDGPEHVGSAAVRRCLKEAVQETLVDAGAIEIGQAQNGAANLSSGVGFDENVLLGSAHFSFEGVRLAWMGFGERRGLRKPVGVDGADQNHVFHAFGNGGVEGLAHHNGMQLELIVGYADEVNQRFYAVQGGAGGGWVGRVPGDDLSVSRSAERAFERGAIASHYTVWMTLAIKRGGDALANSSGGSD